MKSLTPHRSRPRTAWLAAIPLACLLAAGCSDDSNGTPDTGTDDIVETADEAAALLEFGETCAGSGECASGICFETHCTRPCTYQSDCPTDGWACDTTTGARLLCVTTRWTGGDGRFGDYCATVVCDEAAGFRCIRRTTDDAYAYCTHDCTDDRDCPTEMVCRDDEDGRYCRPRTYCEPCVTDDQCGYANDDCIADDAGERFCSQACDPARPTTCPTDSECLEIPTGSGVYQCKPAFGRCVGDGNVCEPCRSTGDCNEGGECITDRYTKYSFCGAPCTSVDDCPTREYYCTEDTSQCRPKKGSCLHPTGGGLTCDNCADFTDCFDGWCLDSNGDGRGESCADVCDPADADACAPWGTCYELSDGTSVVGYACMPHEGMQCWQYSNCVTDCPDGTSGCSHSYCR